MMRFLYTKYVRYFHDVHEDGENVIEFLLGSDSSVILKIQTKLKTSNSTGYVNMKIKRKIFIIWDKY